MLITNKVSVKNIYQESTLKYSLLIFYSTAYLQELCNFILKGNDAIWSDIQNMDEQIKINYIAVEELFSRKTEVAVVKDTDKKKTTEVSVF